MVRDDLTSENKWKMEYLGDPLPSRSFAGDSHPHLLHSVLFRPIHPSYISPSPITALSALGFQFVFLIFLITSFIGIFIIFCIGFILNLYGRDLCM